MIKDSQQLGVFLKAEANRNGVRLAFDTHYDAQNWRLSWWQGATLNCLDFQPLEHGELSVSRSKSKFKFLPRLLHWAHNTIPMFPYLAQVERSNLGTERFPLQETTIASFVSSSINA